jgi:hypothetical protein
MPQTLESNSRILIQTIQGSDIERFSNNPLQSASFSAGSRGKEVMKF